MNCWSMVWIDNHESYGLREWYRQTSTEVVGCQGISCCLYSHPVLLLPISDVQSPPCALKGLQNKRKIAFYSPN